jgi:hypothetical protein
MDRSRKCSMGEVEGLTEKLGCQKISFGPEISVNRGNGCKEQSNFS